MLNLSHLEINEVILRNMISIKLNPGDLINFSACVLISAFLVSLAVGEHWEGTGTSQPSFYMGGKWPHSSGCCYCVPFSKRLQEYSVLGHNYLFCTEFNWWCLTPIGRSRERTIYVSIIIQYHLFSIYL